MATIMVSAIAYVSTFEAPTSSGTSTRDDLRQRSQDALDGIYDIPVEESPLGDNLLSVLLAECMQGDCDGMTSRLDRLLPDGTAYAIYVSNGYEKFPILEASKPTGEAVTVSHLLEPKWSNSFVTTGTTNVNPAVDALVTYTLPIFNSNTLSQGGSPLRVIVHGTRTSDGANYTATSFYSTQAVAEHDKTSTPAVSLYFVRHGFPIAAFDAAPFTVDKTGLLTMKNVTFTVRLDESAGVAVPAGTEITISLPRGWSGGADPGPNPGWLVLGNAPNHHGTYAASEITARMTASLTGGVRDFTFNATFHGDILEYHNFQARLSKGALSEANLLVRSVDGPKVTPPGTWSIRGSDYGFNTPSTDSAYVVPTVGMSLPRPMGSTATTTWTLTVDIPDRAEEGASLSRSTSLELKDDLLKRGDDPGSSRVKPKVVIHRIEIVEQDGAPIFKDVKPVSGLFTTGTWSAKGDRLVWEGTHSNFDGPLPLVFQVTGAGVAGAATAKNPFVPPAEFDAYRSRMLSQIAPGFYRGVFLPSQIDAPLEVSTPQGTFNSYPGYATAGYDTGSQPPKIGIKHNFTSDSVFKSTLLPGTGNYTLNPVTSFQEAIHGSYVAVDKRKVPVGGTVTLSADVQSLLFALSQAGVSAGVNLHVYPPWSGDQKSPIWSQLNLDSGILGSDVTKMALMELNGDGHPDVVVGTSNGRVLAIHGLTGARLQGGVFTAPLQTGAKDGTVTSITHLLPLHLGGEPHIVVGTDKEGQGVYVLGKDLVPKWSYDKSGHDAVSMDAGVDVDGDGRGDVLLGLENGGIYVLRALPGDPLLDPWQGALSDRDDQVDLKDAFYTSLGQPTALVGLPATGPAPIGPGLAVTFQSTPGMGTIELNLTDPDESQIGEPVTSLPRSGFQGVNASGAATWTFYGSPVTVARPTDHDGDVATDIVAGSPAGYVFMMNGMTATQPLFSQLHYTSKSIIDAEAFDPHHAMALTLDGQIRITTDGWTTLSCAYCSTTGAVPTLVFPEAKAIAVNGSHSFWLAGAANLLFRSVPGQDPGSAEDDLGILAAGDGAGSPKYPHLALVDPNATRTGSTESYFATHKHHFNDITFRAVPHNDLGWVVAGPCVEEIPGRCTESLVMRTTDGGHSWTILDSNTADPVTGLPTLIGYQDTIVDTELTRINFTTEKVGWIVGGKGTILRTLDGGATWHGVKPPSDEDVLDVSCAVEDPRFCMAVTPGGAWRATDALAAQGEVGWTSMDLGFSSDSPYAKSLKSIGVVDTKVAIIGAENLVLKTLDGGDSWSALPMNYLESDGNRVVAFPDGRGYVFGGNASTARVFFLHDYALVSAAQTPVIPLGDKEAVEVSLVAEYSEFTGVSVRPEVSTNGGKDWQTLDFRVSSREAVIRPEGDLERLAELYRFEAKLHRENVGSDFVLRLNFESRGDSSLITAQIREPVLELVLRDKTTNRTDLVTYPLDLTDPETFDPEATTAYWDMDRAVLHQPLVDEYWTRNVSGEVKDVQTGHHVTGSPHHDVWVATGGVLAANSPEHVIYAGSDTSKWLKNDNRIYLLDGEDGSIVARTPSFPGNVTALALGDGDGDGKPEYLYATTWDPVRSNGTIMALDPLTLKVNWTIYLDIFQPSDLVASTLEGGLSAPVVGTRAHETGQNAIPGKVYSFDGKTGDVNWGSIPDQLGRYVIQKQVPPSWLFGPYVVEVEVEWTNELGSGVEESGAVNQVLQTARFYDYFLVSPPDLLAPPSPVYQVHLVTWYRDWQ